MLLSRDFKSSNTEIKVIKIAVSNSKYSIKIANLKEKTNVFVIRFAPKLPANYNTGGNTDNPPIYPPPPPPPPRSCAPYFTLAVSDIYTLGHAIMSSLKTVAFVALHMGEGGG